MDLLNIVTKVQIQEFGKGSNKGNFYLSNLNFQIWWLISGMEVMKNPKLQLKIF